MKVNEKAISDAIKAVKEEKISQAEACRRFKIKKTTLNDRINGRHGSKVGKPTVLSEREKCCITFT